MRRDRKSGEWRGEPPEGRKDLKSTGKVAERPTRGTLGYAAFGGGKGGRRG